MLGLTRIAARHAAANVMRSGVVQATSPAMPVMRAEAAAAFSTVQRAHHAALVGFQAAPMWALGSSKNPRAAVTALRSFHAAPVLFKAQGASGNDHPQVAGAPLDPNDPLHMQLHRLEAKIDALRVLPGPKDAGQQRAPAIMVVSYRVDKEQVGEFLAWQKEVTTLLEGFNGWLGSRLFPPNEANDSWVATIVFTHAADHERWMASALRKDWLERGKKFFRVRQRDVVYTSLRGWTGDEPAKPGVVEPAKWKVVAKVVTPLYPIAIGLNLAVVPYLTDIPMAPKTLILNVMIVTALTYAGLPMASKLGFLNEFMSQPATLARAVPVFGFIGAMAGAAHAFNLTQGIF